jgi:hemerythrin-like domain-containing protein
VLQENVEHHVEEEEGELFKKAKKVIDSETAEQIASEIEAFKEEQIHALES